MIVITVPISAVNEQLDWLRSRLDHLVKYHPDYAGHQFTIQKCHISLVRIDGNINPPLRSHIEANIRDLLWLPHPI